MGAIKTMIPGGLEINIVNKAFGVLAGRLMQMLSIAYVFVPLERLIPFRPKQRLFRAYLGLDLLHYFAGGIFIMVFVRWTLLIVPPASAWLAAHNLLLSVRALPVWAQLVIFEASWTFLGYWLHRLEHSWMPLWRLHNVHECTSELDWLSAFRLHPLDPALFQVLTIVPLLLFFQMRPPVAVAYTVYSYIFAHIQHSNIVFPLGPLKYILPTPLFHRWHHARTWKDGEMAPMLCNFGQYPIWDLLFGTLYLPGERPEAYGNPDGDKIPMDYLAQLAYPFGCHEVVLAWEQRLTQRFSVNRRLSAIRRAVTPIHETLENQLARLCIFTSPRTDSSNATLAPVLEREKV